MSHTCLSFHNVRFIRELPQNPIESHVGYIQRGGVCVIEVSRSSDKHEVLVTVSICRWRGGHLSQVR